MWIQHCLALPIWGSDIYICEALEQFWRHFLPDTTSDWLHQSNLGCPREPRWPQPCGSRKSLGGPLESLGGQCDSWVGPCDSLDGPHESLGGPLESLGGQCDSWVGPCDSLDGPYESLGGPHERLDRPCVSQSLWSTKPHLLIEFFNSNILKCKFIKVHNY